MVPQLPLPSTSKAAAAPKQKRPYSRRLRVVIGTPLSYLITIEAANIWSKLFWIRSLLSFEEKKYIEQNFYNFLKNLYLLYIYILKNSFKNDDFPPQTPPPAPASQGACPWAAPPPPTKYRTPHRPPPLKPAPNSAFPRMRRKSPRPLPPPAPNAPKVFTLVLWRSPTPTPSLAR